MDLSETLASPLLGYSTKAELVYRHLRAAIVSGRIGPGQRVVVDQFASDLGVSKVPVREAVLRLVGEGWVELRPHVGPVIPELSSREIEETAVIRAALESTAIRYAVRCRTDSYIAALDAMMSDMDEATGDLPEDFAILNRAYHKLAISTCPIVRLRGMAEEMMERTIRYRTAWRVPYYSAVAQREHHAIHQAIADGNQEEAATLTYSHILTGAEALRRRLEESPSPAGSG